MRPIETLAEYLPTKTSKWIAGMTSPAVCAVWYLVGFFPVSQSVSQDVQKLILRVLCSTLILMLSSLVCLALVVRHYNANPHKKQNQIKPQPETIDNTKEQILLFLASRKKSFVHGICRSVKIDTTSAEHHLEILRQKNMANHTWDTEEWNISPSGHTYLEEHKLIK